MKEPVPATPETIAWLKKAIASFEHDPADSVHQRGYLCCLMEQALLFGVASDPGIRQVARINNMLPSGAPLQ